MEELLDSFVWVKLKDESSFLKVCETLTRIGIYSKDKNTLSQSVHLLHKRGQYAIVHFKELFLLDGKTTDFSESDLARRNTIANLLDEWGLIEVIDKSKIQQPMVDVKTIKIIPYKDKEKYELVTKYTLGKHKRKNH